METLLKNFKSNYLEILLTLLWNQWSNLGVAGYETPETDWYIDPEALLILTCCVGRYDARLFDEALNWLVSNGQFINVQRLRSILRKENPSGIKVLSAISEFMRRNYKWLKWEKVGKLSGFLTKPEPLFFSKDGMPLKIFREPEPIFNQFGLQRGKIVIRERGQKMRILSNGGVLLKLRSLFGINARCETILYLLTHEQGGHPSQIARETYYAQKTVQDTLIDMTQSGLIQFYQDGREKYYYLKKQDWFTFLRILNPNLNWINWPVLFKALEDIWNKINQEGFESMEPILIASELRKLMADIRPKIESSVLGRGLSDETLYLGENYISVFLSDINRIMKEAL